jgi:hypothetical protein
VLAGREQLEDAATDRVAEDVERVHVASVSGIAYISDGEIAALSSQSRLIGGRSLR